MSNPLRRRTRPLAPPPLFVIAATLLVGLSGRGAWQPAPCPSLPGGLSLLGLDVSVVIESPVCGLSLHDLGTAMIHAGPLVWTISLATLLLGFAVVLATTWLGLAIGALLNRARDWFSARLLPAPEHHEPASGICPRPLLVRLTDLRSVIVQRPPQRRGPPVLLLHG